MVHWAHCAVHQYTLCAINFSRSFWYGTCTLPCPFTLEGTTLLTASMSALEWYKSCAHTSILSKILIIMCQGEQGVVVVSLVPLIDSSFIIWKYKFLAAYISQMCRNNHPLPLIAGSHPEKKQNIGIFGMKRNSSIVTFYIEMTYMYVATCIITNIHVCLQWLNHDYIMCGELTLLCFLCRYMYIHVHTCSFFQHRASSLNTKNKVKGQSHPIMNIFIHKLLSYMYVGVCTYEVDSHIHVRV